MLFPFFELLIIFHISLSCPAFATPLLSFRLTKVDTKTATLRGSYDTRSTLKHQALSNASVTNLDSWQYAMDVGVEDSPTYYSLAIDRGSSITSIRGQNLQVTYDVEYLAGPEYYDTITLTPGIVITNQSISNVTAYTTAWSGVDGVFGVGPIALTVGSLSPNIMPPVPTVLDNTRKQGFIQQQIMGISFTPASTDNKTSEVLDSARNATPGMQCAVFDGETIRVGVAYTNHYTSPTFEFFLLALLSIIIHNLQFIL
ncbi:hypothetical protein M405DRAFT_329590 [Rhizopogon salebrosus TDB-379]|nr:hypothetical protein M405DRAFT_329590 [Rhizopogon salebrosus TDB-379]